MAKSTVSSVKVHPRAIERLRDLQIALQADFGLTARHEDIASALLLDATPSQLAGMLLAYQKQVAAEQASATQPGEDGAREGETSADPAG